MRAHAPYMFSSEGDLVVNLMCAANEGTSEKEIRCENKKIKRPNKIDRHQSLIT